MVRDAAAPPVDEVLRGQAAALDVVGVDVLDVALVGGQRPPDEHVGHARRLQRAVQLVVAVVGHDDRAVDVPVAQVAHGALALAGAGDHEDHLDVGVGERGAQAVEGAREERVRQHALVGLRDHQGDRVGALGDERACGAVRGVAQVGDGGLDRGEGLGRDAQARR